MVGGRCREPGYSLARAAHSTPATPATVPQAAPGTGHTHSQRGFYLLPWCWTPGPQASAKTSETGPRPPPSLALSLSLVSPYSKCLSLTTSQDTTCLHCFLSRNYVQIKGKDLKLATTASPAPGRAPAPAEALQVLGGSRPGSAERPAHSGPAERLPWLYSSSAPADTMAQWAN